jgi:cell division protein FtsI/penicillin-binding protein 2
MILTRRALLYSAVSLREQSAALLLDHAFPDPALSYLLLNAVSGRVICSRWLQPEDRVPVGSLVKPFTAIAYRDAHGSRFPLYTCHGCWLPQGHGQLEIATALANSCNAYFLELASQVQPEAMAEVARRFGIAEPSPNASPEALIGLGETWPNSPLAVARAYCELAARKDPLLAGLALSAKSGTGRGIGPGAYAKTGTVSNQGFAIAVYPTDAPRFAMLVRVHGITGAHAAIVCGQMRAALGGIR